ncbi:MAG TPA: FkbM family methyltransferase [Porticoccaceae bacterium]|nr:FkbM family methyltransferase [Porticoccaceae bacterium]HCO59759.1 FkbM family methyltransferase [Porticoccaceae bacterium]
MPLFSPLKSLVKRCLGQSLTYKLRYLINKDKNQLYDSFTFMIMDRALKPGRINVDVGCHEGAVLDEMIARQPDGEFYAFEPLPHLFEHLQRKYQGVASVRLHNIALSDAKGESQFNHVVTNPGYSGFIKRRYDRPAEEDELITVNTDLLDAVLPEQAPVGFIKTDVEGAELQVLKGAANHIKRDKPVIVFEHGFGAADVYGTQPEDIYHLLCDEYGLSISLMEDWLAQKAPLSLEEFKHQFHAGLNYYFVAA